VYVPNAKPNTAPPAPALAGTGKWGTVVNPEPLDRGNLTREIPALAMDLNDSEVDEAFAEDADLLGACKIEYDRVGRELDELRLLIKQSTRELEKLNHRKVLMSSKVREMEEHLEHHSRADIRATYLAATESEMRAFMISEQREQLQAKFKAFSRYARFLKRAIDAIPELSQSAQWNSAADMWGTSVVADAAGGLPALPDMAASQWQQQLGVPDASTEQLRAQASPGFGAAARHTSELAAVARVIQAQEDIRHRVAQRLHDGPTQSLANVMLTAEICEKLVSSDPRHAQSELANLKSVVNAALQETRKFIFELRPMTLDDLGLVATLRRYASELATKYQVQMPFTGPQGDRRLPKEIEVPVFRVAQEALANAVEHSRGTVIHTSLALQPEALVLVVEDNGTGFDVEPVLARALEHETIGIASMQERAELLGGWLRIESTRGRGTRVELTVPVANAL
jgi:two-component system sensor histidine kinase DegS